MPSTFCASVFLNSLSSCSRSGLNGLRFGDVLVCDFTENPHELLVGQCAILRGNPRFDPLHLDLSRQLSERSVAFIRHQVIVRRGVFEVNGLKRDTLVVQLGADHRLHGFDLLQRIDISAQLPPEPFVELLTGNVGVKIKRFCAVDGVGHLELVVSLIHRTVVRLVTVGHTCTGLDDLCGARSLDVGTTCHSAAFVREVQAQALRGQPERSTGFGELSQRILVLLLNTLARGA